MIQITPQTTAYVACHPVDFRKGHDGLCKICKEIMEKDPFSGAIFVFTNKRKDGLKLLFFDRQGFWLCHKRLSKGVLSWWPESTESGVEIDHKNLLLLIWNGDFQRIKMGNDWK